MKKSKLSRIAALLAAGALLVGGMFMSCSSGGDDDDDDNGGGGGTADTSGVTDSLIKIEYTDTPTLASSGNAYIYNGATLVDTISVTGESLYGISSSKGTISEIKVDDQLITVEDNYVVIVPHNNSSGYSLLSPSTTYTVVLDDGLVTGTRASSGDITFTTRSKQTPANNTITVGSSDSANFYTLQGALNYIRASESTGSWTINVEEGKYHELLFYYGSATVTIAGPASDSYGDKAYVYWRNNQHMGNSQRSRQSFIWQGGDLTIKNMTFENTSNRTVEGNTNVQAETLYFDCKSDLVVYNSSFISYQDTLLLGNNGGRAWFYKDYISGDVDFIWGYADVALFEKCKIVCRADGIKNDAKIFASRTVVDSTAGKGFVLMNSNVEIEDGCAAAYGRSSGADTQASVFNNTFTTDGESASLSTSLWGGASDTRVYEPNGEMAVGYKDYNNTLNGTLVDTSSRLANTADMSVRLYNREYDGRWTILNRQYNTKTEAYETKSSIWDISAYETEFSASEDTSKENIYVEPVYTKNVVGGNTVQLVASTTSSSSLTYTYESSDSTNLASVDENGLVTTVTGADGTVTITATGSNGETDIAQIKVIPTKVDVTSISFDAPESVDAYALSTVTVTFNPTDATIQTLNWEATGDIRIVDPDSKTAVTSLTESSLTSVQIEGIAPGGSGTLTATSTDNTSATAKKTISISSVRDYNVDESVAVQSCDESTGFGILNFQSKVGIWHDLYIEGYYGTSKTAGKISNNGSSEKIQSRYGTIYIPVTASSVIDMACQTYSDSQPFATDFTDAAGNAPTTYEGDEETYKYHYKWELDYTNDTAKIVDGATVKALYDAATVDTSRSWTNHTPDESAKYFAIVIPGGDRYWTHITVTEDSSIHHEAASATLSIANFANASTTLDLNGTATTTQTTTATASDNTTPTVTYSSDNESIATVDSSTGEVTAKAIGVATITATAAHATDENVTKVKTSYSVTVKDTSSSESYSVDFTKVSGVSSTGTYDFGQFSSTGGKYHGTNYGWIWNANGTLTVPVTGSSTITIYNSYNGNGSANTITVSKSDSTATLGATSLSSTAGDHKSAPEELSVTYTAGTGSNATVTFTFGAQQYLSKVAVTSSSYSSTVSANALFDFRTLFSGLPTSGSSSTGSIKATGGEISYTKMYYKDTTHGAYMYNTSTISFTVSGACTIYLGNDSINGTSYTIAAVNSSSADVSSSLSATTVTASTNTLATTTTDLTAEGAAATSFTYNGTDAATITISVTGQESTNYLPAMQVVFSK